MMNQPYFKVKGTGDIPVLAVHGFMMRGEMFDPFVDVFGSDVTMLVPDLRGFGKSQHLPGPYRLKQMMTDLDHLISEIGWSSVHVIGYSMGGVLAQMLAVERPERVRSLVLCSTFCCKSESSAERFQIQMFPTVIKRIGCKGIPHYISPRLADIFGKMDRKTYLWYREMLINNRDDVVLLTSHDLFKIDLRTQITKINTPTYVWGSDSDLIVPLKHAYQLAGSIKGAKLKIVPDAGHAMIHTHADLFSESVLEFLLAAENKYRNRTDFPSRQAV